jgi:hypothetical protein
LDAESFIRKIKQELIQGLEKLNSGMPENEKVKISTKKNGWIGLSPLEPQPEPLNLFKVKSELTRRWPMTNLLDILKEADLRIQFSSQFKTTGVRETIDRYTLQNG